MVPRTRMMGMTTVYGNRHVDRNLICKKFHNEKKPIVLFNRYTLMKVLITNIRNLIIIGAEYQIGSNIIPVLSFSMHGKKALSELSPLLPHHPQANCQVESDCGCSEAHCWRLANMTSLLSTCRSVISNRSRPCRIPNEAIFQDVVAECSFQ